MEAAMTTEDVTTENVMKPQIVVRRLAAAEGYLELGLPNYALAELNTVTDPGAFAPIAELFRGEALQAQEKYADAIEPLNRAANMFPAPFNQRALLALSNCYRKDGQTKLADETAASVDLPEGVTFGCSGSVSVSELMQRAQAKVAAESATESVEVDVLECGPTGAALCGEPNRLCSPDGEYVESSGNVSAAGVVRFQSVGALAKPSLGPSGLSAAVVLPVVSDSGIRGAAVHKPR